MAFKALDYFYDGQQRRFLAQVVRAFSGFQYQTGWNANGAPQLVQIPCRMALNNTNVAQIIKNGNDNAAMTAPMIVVYQTGLRARRQEMQNLRHIDTRFVTERAIDPTTGQYTNEIGNSYTVERLMPRPFEMDINVDIWTTNLDQKYQLIEQILLVFWPDIQIQNSDNALDWSAIATLQLDDEINWSSRSIPIGTGTENIDITTLRLRLPMYLSPPAKVKRQVLIEQIVANVLDTSISAVATGGTELTRQVITPGEHHIEVKGNRIKLMGPKNSAAGSDGLDYHWEPLIKLYGRIDATQTTIHLKVDSDLDDWSRDIIGVVQYDPADPSLLIWNLDPDTLPANTLTPVLAIIDPRTTYPGNGLPAAAAGQRYLFIESISPGSTAWGGLGAEFNDIVEWNGANWTVAFRPEIGDGKAPVYVTNTFSGKQLRWNGLDWVSSIEGIYPPGLWRLRNVG